MNKTIKTIKTVALAALFIFPGLSAFPQDARQADETVQSVQLEEEDIAFPILIGIP